MGVTELADDVYNLLWSAVDGRLSWQGTARAGRVISIICNMGRYAPWHCRQNCHLLGCGHAMDVTKAGVLAL